MVTYNIDDTYCPCGEKWTRVKDSSLFGDYYYCEKCDKIFTPTVQERTQEWFDENYKSDRRTSLITLAKITEAKKKITKEDLKKLGYL